MKVTGICQSSGVVIGLTVSVPLNINGGEVFAVPVRNHPGIHVFAIESPGGNVMVHATVDQLKVLRDCLANYIDLANEASPFPAEHGAGR